MGRRCCRCCSAAPLSAGCSGGGWQTGSAGSALCSPAQRAKPWRSLHLRRPRTKSGCSPSRLLTGSASAGSSRPMCWRSASCSLPPRRLGGCRPCCSSACPGWPSVAGFPVHYTITLVSMPRPSLRGPCSTWRTCSSSDSSSHGRRESRACRRYSQPSRPARSSGGGFNELVDHPQALRRRVFRKPRPAATGKLTDIDVAMPVYGHAVRRGELPGGETGMHFAEPSQHLTLGSVDADARSDIGPIPVDLTGSPGLADIDERVGAGRHAHAVRPMQIIPLSFELAVAVEHLDPMVLAVGDIDPAVGVAADVVRNVELARVGAGLAP